MKWIQIGLRIVPLVVGAIHAVESFFDKSKKGKDKQDAAVDAVAAMIKVLELGLEKDIMNEEEFQNLLRKLIDDYVAIQNFIAEFKNKQG